MEIVISGASGFLGRHLRSNLEQSGHTVIPLVRDKTATGIYWDPLNQVIDMDALNGYDAIIHLAGENVSERWTIEKKSKILKSRVIGTDLIANTLIKLAKPPSTFISASAIGYYGERGAELLTEDSGPGKTFLSQVCTQWEAAANLANQANIRTLVARFGIIFDTTGGAFPHMLAPFRLGAGGRLGTGHQYMSWITLEDTLSAIQFLLAEPQIQGPVNIVSPQPVSNLDFTTALAGVLHKPALLIVPTQMAHLAFGQEMADEILLCSARVLPKKLANYGFNFQLPDLTTALISLVQPDKALN